MSRQGSRATTACADRRASMPTVIGFVRRNPKRSTIMLKFALSAVILGLSTSAALADATAVNAGELKWGPAPPILPKGAEAAVGSGDPGGKDLYAIRLRSPANYLI